MRAVRSRRERAGVVRQGAAAGPLPNGLLGLQRVRVLTAAIGAIASLGYPKASVAAITARAGVSRRTFYEIFDDREACLVALLRGVESRVEREIAVADVNGSWRERIRMGLWVSLCLFDEEPALAQVCLLESQRAGELVLAERERLLSRLIGFVDEGRLRQGKTVSAGSLTAEALVGACIAVVQGRIAAGEATSSRRRGRRGGQQGSLPGLLGELMSMIVLPYLGPAAARRELTLPLPDTPVQVAAAEGAAAKGDAAEDAAAVGSDPLAGLPLRLTYRTARVLLAVSELASDGAVVSNRRIADHAGVVDAGQISKLLARLEHHELLLNTARGARSKGEANSWSLTPNGRQLLCGIGAIDVPAGAGKSATGRWRAA